jgi:hypothetical protein
MRIVLSRAGMVFPLTMWSGCTLFLVLSSVAGFAPPNVHTVNVRVAQSFKKGLYGLSMLSTSRPATDGVFEILKSASLVSAESGKVCKGQDKIVNTHDPLGKLFGKNPKTLVVVMPQLGDFDSGEYTENLMAVRSDLQKAGIALRLIGIGNAASARRFASFNHVPMDLLYADLVGSLHQRLGLHGGPNWDVPDFIPKAILKWFADYVGASEDPDHRGVARSWLNYMAMCAGIAAPNTLSEIFRGYIGDKSAPERLRPEEIVSIGDNLVAVRGVTDVKLGPIQYQSLWKNEFGYQRPAELATVRLRYMVEVLSNFSEYVPDQKHLHLRGATFLLDADGRVLYEHRDTGVLAYSKTMARPLTFLQPYIGDKALNPLQLGDNRYQTSLISISGGTLPKR